MMYYRFAELHCLHVQLPSQQNQNHFVKNVT